MNQINVYYRHSGAIGLMGPVYMIIFGTVGTLVLGIIYGYAIFYIPYIAHNFLITLGFGALVGFIVGNGGKLGKVRNPRLLLLFGFLFGLFAEYTGWVSWIFAFSKQQTLVLFPSDVLSVVEIVAEKGSWWDIFGWTPKGTALYVIWGIEATMIIATSTLVSWALLISTPFCERCNRWVEKKNSILPLEPITNPDEFKSQLEQADYTSLKTLQKVGSGSNPYTQIDLLRCPICQLLYLLTTKLVTVGVEKQESDIIENIIINSEIYEMIQNQG